jgi:hypothetical protein
MDIPWGVTLPEILRIRHVGKVEADTRLAERLFKIKKSDSQPATTGRRIFLIRGNSRAQHPLTGVN